MPKIAIVIFDKFTDIDLWLMWDLLNRVRVPDWEPVDPEYTSIMSHVNARPINIDWYNPVRIEDVPYNLYPVYAARGVALYYIGQSSCDYVMLAVVTRG